MKWLYFGQQGKSGKQKLDNEAYFFYWCFKTPRTQVICSITVLCYPSVFQAHLIYKGMCAASQLLFFLPNPGKLLIFKILLLNGLFPVRGLFWFGFFSLNSLRFPNVIFLIFMKVRKKMGNTENWHFWWPM